MIADKRLEKAKILIKEAMKEGKTLQIRPDFVLTMISELQRLYAKEKAKQ